jgi:endoglucanase
MLPLEERKKMVPKKDMYIDIGAASQEEVKERGVRPGDPIIPVSEFAILANPRTYMSKAWDDRVGCALFIQAIQRLTEEPHPNTVYGVGTVQEEVGLRGAKTSAHIVSPDVAIILEVDIAGDVPGIKPEESAIEMGEGPTLLVYDRRMIPNLKLPTDGGMIHIHAGGVPTVVIGVPTRHIHSHVGIMHRDDYDHALELIVALVKKLDQATVQGLTV